MYITSFIVIIIFIINLKYLVTGSSSKSNKPIVVPELSCAPPAVVPSKAPQLTKKSQTSREIRQLRMFKAILIIMITFFLCRLPTWIYLLYKLYNDANTNLHWVLQYSFGALSIFNCVLNPLLYTFLTETIRISFVFLDKFKRIGHLWKDKSLHPSANDIEAVTEIDDEKKKPFYCSEDRKIKLARLD